MPVDGETLPPGDRLAELAEAKRAQIRSVAGWLRDGVPTWQILERVSRTNGELHAAVLEHAIASLRAAGWDEPPVAVTVLVMGSGGRGENLLHPDQDNAFILGEYPDDEHARIDPFAVALAERFNDALAEVGFPLCDGNIMARNPVWRKTTRQWREQLARWSQRRDPVAARFGDSFLDFRGVGGPLPPAESLRRDVVDLLRGSPGAIAALCRYAPVHQIGHGFLGSIDVEEEGSHVGRFDLKAHGTLPLVASARLWALQHGIAATGTRERLSALAARRALGQHDVEALDAAFHSITRLILAQQVADADAGDAVGNHVDVYALGDDDYVALQEALDAIDRFARETRAEFAGELY